MDCDNLILVLRLIIVEKTPFELLSRENLRTHITMVVLIPKNQLLVSFLCLVVEQFLKSKKQEYIAQFAVKAKYVIMHRLLL